MIYSRNSALSIVVRECHCYDQNFLRFIAERVRETQKDYLEYIWQVIEIVQNVVIGQFDEAGDAAFRVTARTLEDLFAGSGLALSKLIIPLEKKRDVSLEEHTITLNSPDLESLLVEFLSGSIYLFDA